MKITQKIKKTLSGTFNVLSGKKGGRAAFGGYLAVAGTAIGGVAIGGLIAGTGGIAVPVLTILSQACVVPVVIGTSREYAKRHDQKKGPSL